MIKDNYYLRLLFQKYEFYQIEDYISEHYGNNNNFPKIILKQQIKPTFIRLNLQNISQTKWQLFNHIFDISSLKLKLLNSIIQNHSYRHLNIDIILYQSSSIINSPQMFSLFLRRQDTWISEFNKLLKQYLQTRLPVWETILLKLVAHCRILKIKKHQQYQQQIMKSLYKYTNSVRILKMIMFKHRLISQQILRIQTDNDTAMIHNMINKCIINNQFQRYLNTQIIPKYLLYLQKRTLSFSIIYIKEQQQQQQKLADCYKLINLINYGLALIPELQHLMRYYQHKHGFVLDFNIVLAIDFATIYQQITTLLPIILAEHNKYNNFLLRQSLLKQVQKIHDKLYIIYNNHYHQLSVKKYKPSFIDLEEYYSFYSPSSSCLFQSIQCLSNNDNILDLEQLQLVCSQLIFAKRQSQSMTHEKQVTISKCEISYNEESEKEDNEKKSKSTNQSNKGEEQQIYEMVESTVIGNSDLNTNKK